MEKLLTADKARDLSPFRLTEMENNSELLSILDTIKLRTLEGKLFYNVVGIMSENTKKSLKSLGYNVVQECKGFTEINW